MSTVTDTAPAASLAVPYSSIPAKPVHWLHTGLVPFRHVTLVTANRGTCKGVYCDDYAARMSRHALMPGETEFDEFYDGPRDIILIAPEDDANETVAWRLAGAGAVVDRIWNLTTFPGAPGFPGPKFTVPEDIQAIAATIHQIEDPVAMAKLGIAPPADGHPRKVGMVVLDPLLALASKPMTTRAQARPVIEELEDLAKDYNLVILLTHHTNADGKAAGSRGIVETVRNEITLSRLPKAPEESPVRLVEVTKTNIGITGRRERFTLTGPVQSPLIVWSCELPPEDVSRGYDVAPAESPAAPATIPSTVMPADKTAGQSKYRPVCVHAWRTGDKVCGNCPRRAKASAPAAEPAKPASSSPFGPIPAVTRYRALVRARAGTGWAPAEVIGSDYSSPLAAQEACEGTAGQALQWDAPPSDVPGMLAVSSAVVSGTPYLFAIVDRRVAAGQVAAA